MKHAVIKHYFIDTIKIHTQPTKQVHLWAVYE